jgi:hypothetical protein
MRSLLFVTLLVTGCGMGMMGHRDGQPLPPPTASSLALQADGTETLSLTWADGDVPRDLLERTTITAGMPWLMSTTAPADGELRLCFAKGFSQAMAGHGPWMGAVTVPDGSSGHRCRCCQHAAHVVEVNLSFDGAGAMNQATVSENAP